jgi:hypothetical protein
LAHPSQRRGLAVPDRRLRQISQLIQGAGNVHQDGAGTRVTTSGIGFKAIQPGAEGLWPVDVHTTSMSSESYALQVIQLTLFSHLTIWRSAIREDRQHSGKAAVSSLL